MKKSSVVPAFAFTDRDRMPNGNLTAEAKQKIFVFLDDYFDDTRGITTNTIAKVLGVHWLTAKQIFNDYGEHLRTSQEGSMHFLLLCQYSNYLWDTLDDLQEGRIKFKTETAKINYTCKIWKDLMACERERYPEGGAARITHSNPISYVPLGKQMAEMWRKQYGETEARVEADKVKVLQSV